MQQPRCRVQMKQVHHCITLCFSQFSSACPDIGVSSPFSLIQQVQYSLLAQVQIQLQQVFEERLLNVFWCNFEVQIQIAD